MTKAGAIVKEGYGLCGTMYVCSFDADVVGIFLGSKSFP